MRKHTEASQRFALIFARSAIFIHALAMAIMASRYSGTEVRSSSAAHSSKWRLHSSIVSSGTMFIEMVMRAPATIFFLWLSLRNATLRPFGQCLFYFASQAAVLAAHYRASEKPWGGSRHSSRTATILAGQVTDDETTQRIKATDGASG